MLTDLRIRSRRMLIFIVAMVQMCVLALGGVCLYQMVRHQIVTNIRTQVFAQNLDIANMITDLLHETGLDHLDGSDYGDPNWERAQTIVEQTKLPAGAFVCILDEQGHILCHPDLRKNPDLRNLNLSEESLSTREGDIPINELDTDHTINGQFDVGPGQTHFVTTRTFPDSKLRLLVHQPESGLVSISQALTSGMAWVALGVMLLVVGLTALASMAIFRRYESQLDEINRHLEEEVRIRTRDSVARLHTLIHGLAALADHRDNDTGAHLERICSYSCILAEALRAQHTEIDDEWISCLRLGASMHDIGKVGVPDAVLLKPGKLTDEEWIEIRKHPTIGAQTLESIRQEIGSDPLIDMAIDITRGHHERWDGMGYPDKLAGEDIPLAARIVALADVYDALTSKRVYKPAFSHNDAARIIIGGRETQFDPAIVDAFIECEQLFRAIHCGLQIESSEDQPAPASAA